MTFVLETPAGKLRTSNPWFCRAVVSEVIYQDAYRLRAIAKHYTPEIMYDIGMCRGEASMLARSIWPHIKVIGFEMDKTAAEEAWKNVPGSMVYTGCVGYEMRACSIVQQYGAADLLVCDFEGGEVPFFHDLAAADQVRFFQVIVGEWHFRTAAAVLREALAKDFHFRIAEPAPQASWGYFCAVNKLLPAGKKVCEALGIT